jgi:hypothetical protein
MAAKTFRGRPTVGSLRFWPWTGVYPQPASDAYGWFPSGANCNSDAALFICCPPDHAYRVFDEATQTYHCTDDPG